MQLMYVETTIIIINPNLNPANFIKYVSMNLVYTIYYLTLATQYLEWNKCFQQNKCYHFIEVVNKNVFYLSIMWSIMCSF